MRLQGRKRLGHARMEWAGGGGAGFERAGAGVDGPGIRRQLRGRLHVNSQAVPSDNELPMRGNSCYRHLLDGFGSAGLLRAFDQVLQGPLLLMEVRAGGQTQTGSRRIRSLGPGRGNPAAFLTRQRSRGCAAGSPPPTIFRAKYNLTPTLNQTTKPGYRFTKYGSFRTVHPRRKEPATLDPAVNESGFRKKVPLFRRQENGGERDTRGGGGGVTSIPSARPGPGTQWGLRKRPLASETQYSLPVHE